MPSSVPSFAELPGHCQRSAVHLELRDSYAATDRYEAWKRGERINWEHRESWWHPYDQLIADTVSRGVVIRRARVIFEPVSDYIRWEHYVTHANVTAGEEVRWLPRRLATAIALPGNDFWLFDDALLRVHHFSGDGGVVEDEITADAEAVKLCSAAFEAVWERATPHHRYQV
ncbi:hypothetical protein J1792_02535 [Streptomyces triculaminicus]|uniref:DUF6879 domain-containing protein n=1 Tax=Streptomyces triculaminicus TaxID=2816232 RepID=A0A939FKY4_9ACTN|nr:DUF6879 family protein [Streptomyces triculaminicus]MBO0651715.1 hypothetical protein [Streptomyces triculaminicus]